MKSKKYKLLPIFTWFDHSGFGKEFCAFDKKILTDPWIFELTPEQFRFIFMISAMCCDCEDRVFESERSAFILRMTESEFMNLCDSISCIEEINED